MKTTIMAKRGRKRTKKRYFTDITELAILAYNKLPHDDPRRNKIFNRFIHKPFNKLIEVTINHLTDHDYIDLSYQDLHHAVYTHILEKLTMFNPENGKAYSYFTIVARNWIIQENDRQYKKISSHYELDTIDNERDLLTEVVRESYVEDLKHFVELYIDYWETNMNLHFSQKRELAVVDSMLHFFKNRENIEEYNKKALYLLIRERNPGLQTEHITPVVKVMKKTYLTMYHHYQNTGQLIDSDNYNLDIFI